MDVLETDGGKTDDGNACKSGEALLGTRTPDPFLTMTPRALLGVMRIPIYAANTAFGGLDTGGCAGFRAGCCFQIVPRGSAA
jgi:hypothetical protein